MKEPGKFRKFLSVLATYPARQDDVPDGKGAIVDRQPANRNIIRMDGKDMTQRMFVEHNGIAQSI